MKKFILILSTLFLFQCEKENISSSSDVETQNEAIVKNLRLEANNDSDGYLELGEKIINPYSIPNM